MTNRKNRSAFVALAAAMLLVRPALPPARLRPGRHEGALAGEAHHASSYDAGKALLDARAALATAESMPPRAATSRRRSCSRAPVGPVERALATKPEKRCATRSRPRRRTSPASSRRSTRAAAKRSPPCRRGRR